MSEDFHDCAKTQLSSYLPGAIRCALDKHTKITMIDTHVFKGEKKSLDKTATMKLTVEQQKAAKAVITHLESLIKLARFFVEEEEGDTPAENREELLGMIKEAQERVNKSRAMLGADE